MKVFPHWRIPIITKGLCPLVFFHFSSVSSIFLLSIFSSDFYCFITLFSTTFYYIAALFSTTFRCKDTLFQTKMQHFSHFFLINQLFYKNRFKNYLLRISSLAALITLSMSIQFLRHQEPHIIYNFQIRWQPIDAIELFFAEPSSCLVLL